MNDQIQNDVAPLASATSVPKPESKAATVSKMLKRPKGATLSGLRQIAQPRSLC